MQEPLYTLPKGAEECKLERHLSGTRANAELNPTIQLTNLTHARVRRNFTFPSYWTRIANIMCTLYEIPLVLKLCMNKKASF